MAKVPTEELTNGQLCAAVGPERYSYCHEPFYSYFPATRDKQDGVKNVFMMTFSELPLNFDVLTCVCMSIRRIGCVILYSGQARFHRITGRALEYLVTQADSTVGKLREVSDYIGAAKQIGVDQVFVPPTVQTDIDQIGAKLNSSAGEVSARTVESSDDIRDLLGSV